jgi:hypothetical protein
LLLNVKIALPVASPTGEMWYDTLFIQSEYDLHQVRIGVDSDLLSGIANGEQPSLSLTVSPNPFRNTVRIDVGLREADYVQAEIHDLNGHLIRTLTGNWFSGGNHSFFWNGCDDAGNPLPGGVYLLRIVTKNGMMTRKLILFR